MRRAVSPLHRLTLLWFFSRRALAYNAVLSVLAAAAVQVIGLAGLTGPETVVPGFAGDAAPGAGSPRVILTSTVTLACVLLATLGYALSTVVVRFVHKSEEPLYRNAGLTPVALLAGSWVIAAGVAAGVATVVSLAAGVVG